MMKIFNIFRVFQKLNDHQKYDFLMKLGDKIKKVRRIGFYDDKNVIKECQHKTWIKLYVKDNRFFVVVDSESLIIKGILYLLCLTWNNKKYDDFIKINFKIFEKIKLKDVLSEFRTRNIKLIIRKIKHKALKFKYLFDV